MAQLLVAIVGVARKVTPTGGGPARWSHAVRCCLVSSGRRWWAAPARTGGWHGTIVREARRLAGLASAPGRKFELVFVTNSFRAAEAVARLGHSVLSPVPPKWRELVQELAAEARARLEDEAAPPGTVEWFPVEW